MNIQTINNQCSIDLLVLYIAFILSVLYYQGSRDEQNLWNECYVKDIY